MAKPAPRPAMRQLIDEVRRSLPFDLPASNLCHGECRGCSRKLLAYLDAELAGWDAQLAQGVTPKLGEIDALARLSRRVHRVLLRNGLIG